MNPFFFALQAIATVVGVGASLSQARTQSKMVKKQVEREQVTARRERRQAIRRTIIAREQQRSQAYAQGFAGSGLAGVQGSSASQLGGNLGFGMQVSGLNQQITALSGQAAQQEAFGDIAFGLSDVFGGGQSLMRNYNYLKSE